MKHTTVIYHANCIDGFTAAWCAWRKFGNDAEYIPAKHGDKPPIVDGRHVYILDFSYPREDLLCLAQSSASIRVLDHHKTAQADLAGLDFCVFDMNQSGAGLSEKEFCTDTGPLVAYVQDRDLWRFELSMSKEINAWIGSLVQNFPAWTRADFALYGDFDGCAAQGEAILRSVERYVLEMAKQARFINFADTEGVPVVNAPYINTSELVGYLAESAPFAMGWFQRADGKYQYSLRSRGDFDVSALAKRFGGGGHKNAAGFTVTERVDK